ncbi:hypothetical protein KIH77_07840 [Bifidobacterium sp. 82T24]|nr:hypothetical protein [Bifidobacterium pluvialisilvae]
MTLSPENLGVFWESDVHADNRPIALCMARIGEARMGDGKRKKKKPGGREAAGLLEREERRRVKLSDSLGISSAVLSADISYITTRSLAKRCENLGVF